MATRIYVLDEKRRRRMQKPPVCHLCRENMLMGERVVSKTRDHVKTAYYHPDCAEKVKII